MRKILSLNIGQKLTLAFLTAIILTSVPLSIMVVGISKRLFFEYSVNSVLDNLRSEEFQLRYHIINRDYWSLFKFTKGLAEKPIVKEVCILDKWGRVLAHSDPQRYPIGSEYPEEGDLSYTIEGVDTNIGKIAVTLDPKAIDAQFAPVKLFLIGSALPSTILSILFGFLIAQRIKSRMDRVRSEMRKLREGRFEEIERVEFLEKDELQDFSDFIFETFEKIREYYDNMEFAQRFYVNLLSSISEVVLVTDKEGRILYANRAIERTGYALNEVIGESIDRFVKREEIPYEGGPYREVLFKGRKESFPALMGEVDTGEWSIITLVDISERKALEESMKRMELFSVLGEMSANFAHEIKNAMLPLKLLTDIDELGREDVETIKTSITRMDRLVNLFLNFARSSDTKVNKVNLRRFVEEILFFLKPKLEEKEVRLVTDIGECEALISKDLVELILINLITNAIDAVERRGKVEVRGRCEGDLLILEVKDNGKGIPKEELGKIFDPFYTSKKGGTGLGLAIVMKNLYLLGGSVEVSSEVGKGSIFRVKIPVQGAEDGKGKDTPDRG